MAEILMPTVKDIRIVSSPYPNIVMSVVGELSAENIGDEASRAHDYLAAQPLLLTETIGEEDTTFSLNLASIGKRRKPANKHADLAATNMFLRTFLWDSYIDYEEDDQTKVAINLGSGQGMPGTGRIFMSAGVRWPNRSNQELTIHATSVMRSVARVLGYGRDYAKDFGYKDLVYAQVERENGVVLETNHLGSCAIGTDGSWYNRESPVFELHTYNLYSVEQQLICMSGALALAHADEDLQQQGR